jgi:hypothetical protein
MRKLLLLLLLPVMCLGEVLDDQEAVRNAVLRRMHVSSNGTAQMTTAQVNSQIEESHQLFGSHLEFDVVPFSKGDTVSVVDGQWFYDTVVNSDFVEGGLLWCVQSEVDIHGDEIIGFVPTRAIEDVVAPVAGDAPRFVWCSEGVFGVYPVPALDKAYLTFYFQYQAHPPELTSDTSSILIKKALRSMLVDHVCWILEEKRDRMLKAQLFKARLPRSITEQIAKKTTTEEIR